MDAKILAISLALAMPGAGSASAGPRPTAEPAQGKNDTELLRDDAKATAEFQRRLRDQVSARNGLVIIEDHSADWSVTVMPATALWAVDCSDTGLAVTFGAGTGETDNGVAVQLTATALTAEKCRAYAPAIAEALQAILKGEKPDEKPAQ